jgi:hypothetical protein
MGNSTHTTFPAREFSSGTKSRSSPSEWSDDDLFDYLVDKKLTTVMIAAIAALEDGFGNLWGHGQARSSLTPVELAMRTVFEEVRCRILDCGNNAKRKAFAEYSEYINSLEED